MCCEHELLHELLKRIKRMEHTMATREDLQAVITTLQQTKDAILAAAQSIIDKLNEANAGVDLTPEVTALGELNTALSDAATRLALAGTTPPVEPA